MLIKQKCEHEFVGNLLRLKAWQNIYDVLG